MGFTLLAFGCGGGGSSDAVVSTGTGGGGGSIPGPNPISGPALSRDDSYRTIKNVALFVTPALGVTANDLATGTLSFPTASVRGGKVFGNAIGSFSYTPPREFVGSDSFEYSLLTAQGTSRSTVTIEVRDGIGSGLSIDYQGQSGRFAIVQPTDPQEFASYLQAQIAGGALQGSTTVFQSDAIPGTRFAVVVDATRWNAALARDYACQIAAQALGQDPLTPEGITAGAQAYTTMTLEAQLFFQIAAVFKGNLLNGPDNYDNPALRQLLVERGLSQFITDNRVGVTDVPTLGAIGAAMNAGRLTIFDVLDSGAFENPERYDEIIDFVLSGQFRDIVNAYESEPF